MHFNAVVLASVASFSIAQAVTTTTTAAAGGSTCAAQNIVEACKSTINAQVGSCAGNDWDCLCTQYQNLLTCYNNCPGAPERSSVQQQVDQYCAAASAYGTKTKTPTATSAAAAATSTTANAGATTGAVTDSPSPTPTNNAAASIQFSGSLAAIVLAGLGLIA